MFNSNEIEWEGSIFLSFAISFNLKWKFEILWAFSRYRHHHYFQSNENASTHNMADVREDVQHNFPSLRLFLFYLLSNQDTRRVNYFIPWRSEIIEDWKRRKNSKRNFSFSNKWYRSWSWCVGELKGKSNEGWKFIERKYLWFESLNLKKFLLFSSSFFILRQIDEIYSVKRKSRKYWIIFSSTVFFSSSSYSIEFHSFCI